MQSKNSPLRDEVIEAIKGFKIGATGNSIDLALDMLIQLPQSRISDELVGDVHMFMRTVCNTYTQWKARK